MYDKAKQMEWRGSKKKRDRKRNAKQMFEKVKQMGWVGGVKGLPTNGNARG